MHHKELEFPPRNLMVGEGKGAWSQPEVDLVAQQEIYNLSDHLIAETGAETG